MSHHVSWLISSWIDKAAQYASTVSDRELHARSSCPLSIPGRIIRQPSERQSNDYIQATSNHEAAKIMYARWGFGKKDPISNDTGNATDESEEGAF